MVRSTFSQRSMYNSVSDPFGPKDNSIPGIWQCLSLQFSVQTEYLNNRNRSVFRGRGPRVDSLVFGSSSNGGVSLKPFPNVRDTA